MRMNVIEENLLTGENRHATLYDGEYVSEIILNCLNKINRRTK